jgi:photosystem II stability/assembly factor-like uncharacterized protein
MARITSIEESTAHVACVVGQAGRHYFSSWEEGRRSWTSEHTINVNDICTTGTA